MAMITLTRTRTGRPPTNALVSGVSSAGDLNAMTAVDRANTELERRGLGMSTVFGARRHERFPDGLPWTCTLRYERRRMTVVYYAQPGLEREPTIAEVVASLFEDTHGYERVHDFVDFCAAFGYKRDSRRSEWAYAARGDANTRLRLLLHNGYEGMAAIATDIGQ